jgi:RimJ/RimL family protein N-acetyltransferase
LQSSGDLRTIVETERLIVRELDADNDAAFVHELLNTPKFIKYIGDRAVRSLDEARQFIDGRYRLSYREHGYGLYTVLLRSEQVPVGICGFVRRDSLPGPDLGFAFLPKYERLGYGFESASAMMQHGRDVLGFTAVYAITTTDNDASAHLLSKLGFRFDKLFTSGAETLRLFVCEK